MLFGEVDIPKPLIEAQEEGKLVEFAGAGVSMGSPSNLPSFDDLAKQIANGAYKRKPDEAIDRFLGRLEASGVRIRERACKLLFRPGSRANAIHVDIGRLFPHGAVRIVTTNFDGHFESALQQNTNVHKTAALPRGSDFAGLVHLHGSIKDGPQSLILT